MVTPRNDLAATEEARLKGFFQSAVNFVALAIGISSGVAQLAGIPAGAGRIVLEIIGIISVFFLVIRYWLYFFVARTEQLRDQLEKKNEQLELQQEGHRRYITALERILDRETPLFQDHLEVTVTIGHDDDTDTVRERWSTVPKPQVTHRAIRPIVPTFEERIIRLEDIEFKSQLEGGGGTITPLALIERVGYLRAWLVFEPALTTPTNWVVDYRPRGLWRPLRDRGYDTLGWDDRLPTADGLASSLTHFVVNFLFPSGAGEPRVVERHNWGKLSAPSEQPSGQWKVTWSDSQPAGRHYIWDLWQSPPPKSPK